MVIEQAQIRTTHNLATLVHHVGITPTHDWSTLARDAYDRAAALAATLDRRPSPLPAIKNIAHGAVADQAAPVRPASGSRSCGSVVTMTAPSWLIAWVGLDRQCSGQAEHAQHFRRPVAAEPGPDSQLR